jgi:hypothetical protein
MTPLFLRPKIPYAPQIGGEAIRKLAGLESIRNMDRIKELGQDRVAAGHELSIIALRQFIEAKKQAEIIPLSDLFNTGPDPALVLRRAHSGGLDHQDHGTDLWGKATYPAMMRGDSRTADTPVKQGLSSLRLEQGIERSARPLQGLHRIREDHDEGRKIGAADPQQILLCTLVAGSLSVHGLTPREDFPVPSFYSPPAPHRLYPSADLRGTIIAVQEQSGFASRGAVMTRVRPPSFYPLLALALALTAANCNLDSEADLQAARPGLNATVGD